MKAIVMVLAVSVLSAAQATVYYFDPENGRDTNDGTSESTPFKTLSKKNGNNAADGDELRLMKGTYRESLWINRNNITVRGWKSSRDEVVIDGENTRKGIYSQVKVTGTADNTSISGLTIRNAYHAGAAGTTFSWGAGIQLTGYGCLVSNCVVESCRVDTRESAGIGFWQSGHQVVDCVISNCIASGTSGGGGVYLGSVSGRANSILRNVEILDCASTGGPGGGVNCQQGVILDNCKIARCTASSNGGGVYVGNSCSAECVFSNSTFLANGAQQGGGVYGDSKTTNIVVKCVFEKNRATLKGGGGICVLGGCTRLDGCEFSENASTTTGGGAYVFPYFCCNCVFQKNIAGGNGGGFAFYGIVIADDNLSPSLESCIFIGNMCTNEITACYGGAACDEIKNGHACYRNCLFAENIVSNGSGGACFSLYNGYIEPHYESCTFVGNGVANANNCNNCVGGGAIGVYNSCSSSVTNCLFWGNWAPEGVSTYVQINNKFWGNNGLSRFHYCLEQNKTGKLLVDGQSNCLVVDDVKFIAADVGDYRLQKSSPAVDAGANQFWMAGYPDLSGRKGRNRIYNETVDIGCYEYWPNLGMVILLK